jgi:CheY-like chemotaxis protein
MTVLRFPPSKALVLVLNDCPETLRLLTVALRAAGFRTRAASSADFRGTDGEGVESCLVAPDVVVYDIGRGGDSEWAFLRQFTELPQMEQKPLVITTTNVVRVEGQRETVYVRSQLQFAAAPCDTHDLISRVAAAIGLSPMGL